MSTNYDTIVQVAKATNTDLTFNHIVQMTKSMSDSIKITHNGVTFYMSPLTEGEGITDDMAQIHFEDGGQIRFIHQGCGVVSWGGYPESAESTAAFEDWAKVTFKCDQVPPTNLQAVAAEPEALQVEEASSS